MRIFTALMIVLACGPVCAAESWTKIADENSSVVLAKGGVVRYGGYGSFVEKTMTAGTLVCGNTMFGDPNVGVVKECSVKDPTMIAVMEPFTPLCAPYGPTSTKNTLRFFVDDQPSNLLSYLVADATKAGAVFTWWCKGKYVNTAYAYMGYRSEVPPDPEQAASAFQEKNDSAKLALMASAATCKPGMPVNAPACTKLAALSAISLKQRIDTTPPFSRWFVAKNGTSPTRPVYPVVNGVRSKTAHKTARAPVGADCTCHTLVIEEGTSSYCLVAYGDNNVALCTQ